MPELALVPDPKTGEIPDGAPDYSEALRALDKLRAEVEMLERDIAGKRLAIYRLEADREADALSDPTRPDVELIHTLWKKACKRRRPLHFQDRERIGRAVKKLGLRKCLQAVAGAAYDPTYGKPKRNGTVDRFDDVELIFREFSKVAQFASRAPIDWEPDVEKIAAITDADPDWIRKRLAK